MADHVVTLNAKQENAAQAIVDYLNTPMGGNNGATVDTWIRDLVIQPIKAKIAQLDAEKVAPIVVALPDATNTQLNQIKAILGIA